MRGLMIRTKVAQVRIAGRNTQGVTVFRTAEGERVVSVERLAESEDEEAGITDGEGVTSEAATEAADTGQPDGSAGENV